MRTIHRRNSASLEEECALNDTGTNKQKQLLLDPRWITSLDPVSPNLDSAFSKNRGTEMFFHIYLAGIEQYNDIDIDIDSNRSGLF